MTDDLPEKRCEICKGIMIQELQDYTVETDGQELLVEDVPVWVCQQCGYMVVEDEVVSAVEDLVEHMDTVVADQEE